MEDLSPADSEAVRRLLAEARTDEPMPLEVAARLEGVLAGLTADRAPDADQPEPTPEPTPAAPAPVVPLHRRRWPQILVAAAAVTAVAFGTTQQLRAGDGTDDRSTAGDAPASATRDAGEPAEGSTGLGQDSESDTYSGGTSPEALAEDRAADGGAPHGSGIERLDAHLRRVGVRDLAPLHPGEELNRSVERLLASFDDRSAYANKHLRLYQACGPFYAVDGGRLFLARFRTHVALVLAHPDLQGRRLVEVYDCESASPRRSVELVTLADGE